MGDIVIIARQSWQDSDTVAAWLEALRHGRWADAAGYATPDAMIDDPASLPHGGRRPVPEHAAAFAATWDLDPATSHAVIEAGDAAVLVHTTGLATARPTGRSMVIDIRTLVLLRNGRVELARSYWRDTAEALDCLRA